MYIGSFDSYFEFMCFKAIAKKKLLFITQYDEADGERRKRRGREEGFFPSLSTPTSSMVFSANYSLLCPHYLNAGKRF